MALGTSSMTPRHQAALLMLAVLFAAVAVIVLCVGLIVAADRGFSAVMRGVGA